MESSNIQIPQINSKKMKKVITIRTQMEEYTNDPTINLNTYEHPFEQ